MQSSIWYRVHFRKKSILVEGEAELARIKARKVPKVVLVEPAKTYTCCECGTVSAWLDSWRWYGSWQDLDDGKPVAHLCGDLCQERYALQTKPKAKRIKVKWREDTRVNPNEPKKYEVGSYRAIDDARRAANPRLFPMPKFPPIEGLGKREGQCKWCGEKITGAYAWQRTTHRHSRGDERDCATEYLLHTDLDAQYRFLLKRDGPGCAILGLRGGHWVSAGTYYYDPVRELGWSRVMWSERLEVDHVIPLWKVAHLPPDERRPYFGPDNLWLLSLPAHREKSRLEATERAEFRSKQA